MYRYKKCDNCNGKGIAKSRAWKRFEEKIENMDMNELEKIYNEDFEKFKRMWFWRHGYDYKNLPPKEEICPVCNGEGIITT